MRWPDWTDPFRRCCGLREGPHNAHYDAWLARERLNQLKRLEIKLADLTRENGELSARLGQAVGILDSYHSFDMDQMGIAHPVGSGGSGALPPVPDSLRQDSGSRRRLAALGGSDKSSSARAESLSGRSHGRSSSLASVPPQVSHRLSLSRQSVGGNSLVGTPLPASPMARKTSLQFQPSARTSQPPPPRVRQQMSAGRAASPEPARAAAVRGVGIPSREELDDLLRQSEPRRRPAPPRARRSSLDTVVDEPPYRPPAPLTTRRDVDEVASVASEPQGVVAAPLPTIGESSGELPVEYEASRALSDGEGAPPERTPVTTARSSGRMGSRGSGGQAPDLRRGSFSFAPPAATVAAEETPRQLALPMSSPFSAGNVAPPSLPAVMVGENTQPVRDAPRLATQARGQVYTGHYSPETSPFARAAARMPATDGKMPLSRHLPPR